MTNRPPLELQAVGVEKKEKGGSLQTVSGPLHATLTILHEIKFGRLPSQASLPPVIKASGLPPSYGHSLGTSIPTDTPIRYFLDRNKLIRSLPKFERSNKADLEHE